MAGAFRRVAVLDPRGAEPFEDLGVRRARGSQPCPHIVVEAIGKARQRHAVDVPFVGVERHAVVRVGQLLDLRGEADVARRLSRSAAFSSDPRKPCRASSAAVVTGAPFGQDQPSLPISMRIAGRSLRKAPWRKVSMLEVESGPR